MYRKNEEKERGKEERENGERQGGRQEGREARREGGRLIEKNEKE